MITIYHNPRCSKSRETLALLTTIGEEQALALNVIDYQKNPLNFDELQQICIALGDNHVQAMLRNNEDEYARLKLDHADTTTALQAIATHPHLLQRPIVTYQNKAAIGRPPEHVLSLFKKA
ncbi:arsenate reductase (glutaredoxin) [Undibacterium sp. Di26W]|uniref:arsenate reductase (glutaredoxin) n=1 Tax=Undibacterium sp. Di26W TaxID=3413035 RepID=UPI003BF1092F